jgi:predicted alpha/beta-fold hydrolase
VLSHYLTKHREESLEILQSAILISIVWNAHTATMAIEKPITKYFVNYALADSLKSLISKHRAILEPYWDFDFILKNSRTLREFDTNFTAPQFKYANVKDYYDDVSVTRRIPDFPIPVFGLSAHDDPMQPGQSKTTTTIIIIIVVAKLIPWADFEFEFEF